jgi:hypothetical protein
LLYNIYIFSNFRRRELTPYFPLSSKLLRGEWVVLPLVKNKMLEKLKTTNMDN